MVRTKLSNICSKIGSGATPRGGKNSYCDDGISFIRSQNILDFYFSVDGLVYINEEQADKLSNVEVMEDDILLNITGDSVARTTMMDSKYLPARVNQHVAIVRAKKELVKPSYILYYLQAQKNHLLQLASAGATRNALTKNMIENLELDIPSLEIQEKTVGILDDIQRKIKMNMQVNKNLLQQTRIIFKHWFTDNPNLNTMKQVPLADICLGVTKGTTPTTLGKTFIAEGINFIKAESILDNHAIDKEKFAFIDSETNDLLKRSIISSGDIVFTIAGTLGRFALIDDSVLPANTNQAVAIIRANQSKVTPEYLYSFFLGNWHNDYYTKRIQQAVQANLSLGTIKSLPIPILSDKAMSEYLGIISPIIAMTKANELEITKLREVRDALLPQLMSGALDVSALDL